MVVGCGIMAVLSFNFGSGKQPRSENSPAQNAPEQVMVSPKKPAESVSITDVPLATGDEPIDQLFVQSGCAVCHTIPGLSLPKAEKVLN